MAFGLTERSFSQLFDARFKAVLAPDGYHSLGLLHYARVVGDVLQFFIAHTSQHPESEQAELSLEAGCLLLCEPHTFLSLDIGGSFPDEQTPRTYVSPTSAQWPQVAELAVFDYLTIGRPRMDKRSGVPGLMDHVFTRLGRSGSPHLWFTLAVGHARLGDEVRARGFAQEALVRYRKAAEETPSASWAHKGEQRSELLVHELYAVRSERLLEGWRSGTLSALGLNTAIAK